MKRKHAAELKHRIQVSPVVALLGGRQVGKTTLARELKVEKPCYYLDLERPSDLAKLADPELYLSGPSDGLVILDEIQRVPNLFPVLRSLVDERRRTGEKGGHFLLLGSASPELLQQSSETLAGRISYLELTPLQLSELPGGRETLETHWERGGYPDSYLAPDRAESLRWRDDFITSHVERHLPQLGIEAAPLLLRRLCTMLAHQQGASLNLSRLGSSLGISGKSVRRYLDLMEGLYLMRILPPWSRNVSKRLVKAPKVYWRDSGVLHALIGLPALDEVLGHPVCGASWEGYCIEQVIQHAPRNTLFSYYRTHAGAEVDLVMETPAGEVIAVEIKRTLSPKLTPGLAESMTTISADRGLIIIPHGEAYPLSETVTACGLRKWIDTQS